VANPFARFFAPDEDEDEGVEEANEIVAFANMPYYPKLLAWLASEADKPMTIGDHMNMVLAAARANTFKEIRKSLQHRVEQAVRLIEAEREDR
jgi:hypothetical protein